MAKVPWEWVAIPATATNAVSSHATRLHKPVALLCAILPLPKSPGCLSMTRNRIACIALVAAGVFCVPPAVMAEDAISHPAKKPIGSLQTQMIPSLAVLNAKGANLQGNKLTLTDIAPNSIVFADRPVRAAGHVLTAHFIKEWDV